MDLDDRTGHWIGGIPATHTMDGRTQSWPHPMPARRPASARVADAASIIAQTRTKPPTRPRKPRSKAPTPRHATRLIHVLVHTHRHRQHRHTKPNMPAKKRAAAAAAAATEDINPIPPPATDDEASATATAKGKAKKAKKAEVVFVTERDPLQRKPSLPAGRGFKVMKGVMGCCASTKGSLSPRRLLTRLPAPSPPPQILSYNVNGLKALVAKDPGLLGRLAAEHSADMLLLQETKLQVRRGRVGMRALLASCACPSEPRNTPTLTKSHNKTTGVLHPRVQGPGPELFRVLVLLEDQEGLRRHRHLRQGLLHRGHAAGGGRQRRLRWRRRGQRQRRREAAADAQGVLRWEGRRQGQGREGAGGRRAGSGRSGHRGGEREPAQGAGGHVRD